jgi:hypothetical protein
MDRAAAYEAASCASSTLARGAYRDVAQLGRAPRWGRGGRRFDSCRPDQRVVAQLGRALGSGPRGRGFKSRQPDFRGKLAPSGGQPVLKTGPGNVSRGFDSSSFRSRAASMDGYAPGFSSGEQGSSPWRRTAGWRSSAVLAGLIGRRSRGSNPVPAPVPVAQPGRAPPRHGGGPWFDPRPEHDALGAVDEVGRVARLSPGTCAGSNPVRATHALVAQEDRAAENVEAGRGSIPSGVAQSAGQRTVNAYR